MSPPGKSLPGKQPYLMKERHKNICAPTKGLMESCCLLSVKGNAPASPLPLSYFQVNNKSNGYDMLSINHTADTANQPAYIK